MASRARSASARVSEPQMPAMRALASACRRLGSRSMTLTALWFLWGLRHNVHYADLPVMPTWTGGALAA